MTASARFGRDSLRSVVWRAPRGRSGRRRRAGGAAHGPAAPGRQRDRRPLLPARPGRAARRRRELHGERRHSTRCTRSVGHAHRLSAARDAARRRMVLSTPPRARLVSRRVPRLLALSCALGLALALPSAAHAQRVHVLAVTGLSGEPAYRLLFESAASDARGQRARALARRRLEPVRAGGGHERHAAARHGTRDARGDRAVVPRAVAPRRARATSCSCSSSGTARARAPSRG